jgi:hypothetical protein
MSSSEFSELGPRRFQCVMNLDAFPGETKVLRCGLNPSAGYSVQTMERGSRELLHWQSQGRNIYVYFDDARRRPILSVPDD